MEEERSQKELFEFEPPRKPFPVFGRIFRPAGFENKLAVTLTLEKVIFIAIGIIMLMVMVYALGVEAGKAAARNKVLASLQKPSVKAVQSIPVEKPAPIAQKIETVDLPYTIALGAFRNKESALQEVNRLKIQGYAAFIKTSGALYVVCAGAYPDKSSVLSKKALGKMKQVRPDAYFTLK